MCEDDGEAVGEGEVEGLVAGADEVKVSGFGLFFWCDFQFWWGFRLRFEYIFQFGVGFGLWFTFW